MILSKEKTEELEKAARPLIKWLNESCHPHVSVIVDTNSAKLTEDVCKVIVNDYIEGEQSLQSLQPVQNPVAHTSVKRTSSLS